MNYVQRDIERIIKKSSKMFPAVIITGPRQSGKTTLVKQLFGKKHRYVSLDDPDQRLMAVEDPKLFLENNPAPLIIDEIQYATNLFPLLKLDIDENRNKKGQYILTGSQSFPLMANVSESLAGRIAVFTLLSFSYSEQKKGLRTRSIENIKRNILRGGYPELVVNPRMDLKLWFNGYLQTYLERDLRQLKQIGDLTDFQRFLELLASVNGQILNLSSFSRDLGIAVNTVKAWISVLEASHQVILVKPYYKNKGKRIIKSPKVYFLDTGLLCYLNGITDTEQTLKGQGAGQRFESIVIGEIVREIYNCGEIPRVFYWRTSYGEEVDFILEKRGKTIPIEVKISAKANLELARNIISFSKLFQDQVNKSLLINLGTKRFQLGNSVEVVPFYQMKF